MEFDILTLFPEAIEGLKCGVIKQALKAELFKLNVLNIREFSTDKHKHCDDTPFGGGAGMVMLAQPLHDAINFCDSTHSAHRIYLSPRGECFSQKKAKQLSTYNKLLFVCGAYEGIDQRVIDMDIDEEISIGDYVLSSGEIPAMVIINCVARLIPGVLGNAEATKEESFENNLLEYPQYTKPQSFLGLDVPEVLLSGNHKAIREWRDKKSLEITKKIRPDLLKK